MVTQTTPATSITVSHPRESVIVEFPDGFVLEGPVGTTIEAFLRADQAHNPSRYDSPMMGALLGMKLRELSYPVKHDAEIVPVLLSSSDGGRIYRRSLIMLLVTAVGELWPGTAVSVQYAVPDGGYYCTLTNRAPLSKDELQRLEAHMREIVAADEPLTKKMMPLDEALALFKSRGEDAKIRLMEQRKRKELAMYTLRGRADYYYGYKLPSTGYLQYFRLMTLNGGFILQYPRKENPNELQPIMPSHKLTEVFDQAEDWLDRMKVEDIGRLNRIVRDNRVNELILVAEALHEQQIARMASEIYERHHSQGTRLVLIAGPSSSGKTTFSKRLAIQLLAHGLRPFTLELDNYFVDRELTPRDENGVYDFESLQAINLPLFNSHLLELMSGKLMRMPRFDFMQGKSVEGRLAQLTENQIIIIEGIHGLNPALVPDIPPESVYRVYVSALTQLNIDSHNRVPTTDVRLLRRIVRDATHRGYNAAATLDRWGSVRRGEKVNIFPYQENADAMFNSALVYELASLRPLVEPLLQQVEPGTLAHIEANRLLSFIRWVAPFSAEQESKIPDTSILREFIGGSILTDYHPVDLSVGDEVPPEV